MTRRRFLVMVCVLSLLLTAGSGLPLKTFTDVTAGAADFDVATLRQRILDEALHAYDVSYQGGNYPGENRQVLEKLFEDAYSVLVVYSRCIMADFYPEAFKAWDESFDRYLHFRATYHDGPQGGDKEKALKWLTEEPKAGGECVFFANLVAARAGWTGLLNYTTTTHGFTRSDGTVVHPVPAEYGKVHPGDILMSTPPYRHTAVVVEVAPTGATVVESSYGCTERVGKRVMPWDELARYGYHVVILDPEAPECFGDLAGCPWAAPAIDELAAQKVIQGVAPNVFDPDGFVTRAQFAALMQRAFALGPAGQPLGFLDVQAGTWQYDPVQAVAPYMPAVAAGRFAPDEPIDRETVAFVLASILSAKGEATLPDANSAEVMLTAFSDAAAIAPARRPAVAAIVDVRIMTGLDDGTFQPRGRLTRAQVAVVLQRVVQLLSDLVTKAPAVVAVTPDSGPQSGGIQVVLTGRNFHGASAVSFGCVLASTFTVDSESRITAVSPAGTGTVNVTVTNAYGTSPMTSDGQFTYTPVTFMTTLTEFKFSAVYCVQETHDRGYILAGRTEPVGYDSDRYGWLVKLDALGDQEWSRTYGGGDDFKALVSVQPTQDGGYIAAGLRVLDATYGHYGWLLKVDALGNEEWSRTYGGGDDYRSLEWVQPTRDGGYIMAGAVLPDDVQYGWLLKVDAGGSVEWSRVYEDWGSARAGSVEQTREGGYIVAMTTVAVKTDARGVEEWRWPSTPGPDVYREGLCSAEQTPDGGYILGGYSYAEPGLTLIKLDAQGRETWSQNLGEADQFVDFTPTSDGGYILVGLKDTMFATMYDFLLVKTDALGRKEWSRTFGGSDGDQAESVQQTQDGGYVVAGNTGYQGWILKTDARGQVLEEDASGAVRWGLPPQG